MSWYQHGQNAAECPRCGKKKLHASRPREREISPDWWEETVGPGIFRMHRCKGCQGQWVSVHLLLTPEEMVRQGIWPLTSSGRMR